MPISVSCPNCSARVNAPDSAAGKRAKCPKCGGVIPIPAEEPEVVEDDFEVVEDEPTPKKKPRVVADADDERPKKKSRRPADDDEDDERPRKKGKSKKKSGGVPMGVWIGGGVALLLLIGVGAYFAFSGGKSDKPTTAGGPAAKPQGISWAAFDAPDGSFAAAFPDGPPTTETMESLAQTTGDKSATPEKIAETAAAMKALGIGMEGWSRSRGDRKYIIMIMSFPAAQAGQLNADAISKQVVEQGGDKIISQTNFTSGSLQGKEILSRDEKTKKSTFGRIGVVGAKVVFAFVQTVVELKADDADGKQFFEKFQWKQ